MVKRVAASEPASESSPIATILQCFCRRQILLFLAGLGVVRLLQLLLMNKLEVKPDLQTVVQCNSTFPNMHWHHDKVKVQNTSTDSNIRHNTSYISHMQTAARPSGCQDVLLRMHAWNNCWRQHMVKQQITQERSLGRIPCTITSHGVDSNSSQVDFIGAPVYTIGNYVRQGFGRVVAHTGDACILAFLFGRPCLLNLLPRDRYYTWRSFIQPGTLNWDPTILHTDPLIGPSLESLTQLLPSSAHGDWGDTFDEKAFLEANPWVAPMQEKVDETNWISLYHAGERSDSQNSHKVLVSPNWGSAWFPRINTDKIIQSQYQCSKEVLAVKVQNAMYGPTDLLNHLHESRLEAAIQSGMWNNDNSPANTATVPHPTLQLLPRNKDTVYGTIHVRTFFIMKDTDAPVTTGDIVSTIRHCVLKASQLVSETSTRETGVHIPENWWLLADDAKVAISVVTELDQRQQTQQQNLEINRNNTLYNQDFPIVSLYHNYSSDVVSVHSAGDKATGLFGHPVMASSLEDWIALHKSRIAIVGPGSAYADSGAQGGGKIRRDVCGADDPSTLRFTIFF
jgi:hypothetical protein